MKVMLAHMIAMVTPYVLCAPTSDLLTAIPFPAHLFNQMIPSTAEQPDVETIAPDRIEPYVYGIYQSDDGHSAPMAAAWVNPRYLPVSPSPIPGVFVSIDSSEKSKGNFIRSVQYIVDVQGFFTSIEHEGDGFKIGDLPTSSSDHEVRLSDSTEGFRSSLSRNLAPETRAEWVRRQGKFVPARIGSAPFWISVFIRIIPSASRTSFIGTALFLNSGGDGMMAVVGMFFIEDPDSSAGPVKLGRFFSNADDSAAGLRPFIVQYGEFTSSAGIVPACIPAIYISRVSAAGGAPVTIRSSSYTGTIDVTSLSPADHAYTHVFHTVRGTLKLSTNAATRSAISAHYRLTRHTAAANPPGNELHSCSFCASTFTHVITARCGQLFCEECLALIDEINEK